MNEYNLWYENVTPEEKEALKALTEKERKFLFGSTLKFGTAGIRAKMMLGNNMLNVYTVRRVARGIAKYVKDNFENKTIVLGYDGRNNSQIFKDEMVAVLTCNGIKTYVTDRAVPTPYLSYLVTILNATVGIMITASHSPKEYNGIKLYNITGAQIPGDVTPVIKEAIDSFADIFAIEKKAIPNELMAIVDFKYYNQYQEYILSLTIDKTINYNNLSVVYTPQHGVGNLFTENIFKSLGVKYTMVTEQMGIDGNFTNTEAPNPEKIVAFNKAIGYGLNTKSDIIISHDPDADRLGVMVWHNEQYIYLTGNQIASLMLHYIVKKKSFTNGFIVKSVVSTNLVDRIANKHNVEVLTSLTGFKNIIKKVSEGLKSNKQFVFAFEEAIGYCTDVKQRDKDGFGAMLLILEMAASLKNNGLTLCNALEDIYHEYGYFSEETLNVYDETLEGADHIKELVDRWRRYDEDTLVDYKVEAKEDYLSMPGFESSNFIKFKLQDDSMLVVRPSGTEPECKYYMSMTGATMEQAKQALNQLKAKIIEEQNNDVLN